MQQSRLSLLQIGLLLLLIVLTVQLGGIWIELRHIRSEQVKNKYYGVPEPMIARIPNDRKALVRRQWESTARVEVEGTVDVDVQNPVDVDVQNQPIEIEGNVTVQR